MKKKVFISILTILISIPLFMDTPLANTTNIQTTNHGTITYDVSGDSNSSDQMGITLGPLTFNVAGKKVSTFTYELDNVYTGTITMQGMGPYFSGGQGIQYNCELYMTNCTVADRSDDKITFYIKEQSNFSVSLVRDNDGTMKYNDWYQIYSETLTVAGSELNTLNAIYVYVHSLSDDVLDIKQSVVNNLPDIYSALGYDVDNTSSTMRADLQSLKTIMNNIGTQIGTFSGTTLAGTMTSMQSYLIAVDQKLAQVKTNTNSIITAINNLGLKLDTIDTDIDQLIDVMTDIKYNQMHIPPYARMFMESLTRQDISKIQYDVYGNYVTLDTQPYHMYMTYNTPMVFVYETNVAGVIPKFYSESVTTTILGMIRSDVAVYYAVKVSSTANGYKDYTWEYANTNKKIYPLYLGPQNTMPAEYQFILGNYFNDAYINRLDLIKNAIQNMAVNVNNMTVNATGITYNVNNTQVNNSVNTYNTDIQNVYNVENDFSTSFNTYNEQFTPDFTETMSTIQSVPSVMNNVVNDLYNLPFIKYPLLLTLAGIVLIALLGV